MFSMRGAGLFMRRSLQVGPRAVVNLPPPLAPGSQVLACSTHGLATQAGEDKEKMAATFSKMAEGYQKLFINNFPMFEKLKDLVISELGNTATGKTILDVGAGPGEPGLTIAKALPDSKVIVTDNAPAMVEKAAERSAGLNNVVAALASADDLSAYADNSVDAVTMCYVLMFVPDRAKTFSEICRVLKPGGVAYVTVWKEMNLMGPTGIAKDAMLKFCSKWSFTPPPPAANPMACSEEGVVESLVGATPGLVIESTDSFTTYFNMGDDNMASVGLMFAINSGVQEFEDQGNPGASEAFVNILREVCKDRGYMNENNVAIIPGNVAQILVARKQ